MIKIIFSDFDDTMIHHYSNRNYFDDYPIHILKRVQEHGIKFCIVTGRNVSFFDQYPNMILYVDYILNSNGSCIYDVKRKKYIYQQVIEKNSFQKIIQYAFDHQYSFFINCMDVRYRYGELSSEKALLYDPSLDYQSEQIVLFFPNYKKGEVSNYLSNLSNIVVNNITFWDQKCSMDLNDIHVSKGKSILWLCQYLDISLSDAIAFGDGVNDVSMFQVVGKSVAVGNAPDKIKQYCDDVSLKCIDYGIYKYIEDKILK